ncbi:ABC transporter substrate-binding protein [Fervidobacterium sp.]
MYRILILFTLMFVLIFLWYNYSSKVVGFIYNPLTSAEAYLAEAPIGIYLIPANIEGDLERIFRNFASRGVKFVVGPSTSADGKKILPYLRKYNMISLSPTISSPRLLKSGYIYSLTPSNDSIVEAFKKYLSKLGTKNLLLVLDDTNKEYSDDFKRLLEVFPGSFVYYNNLSSLKDVKIQDYDTAVITTFSKPSIEIITLLKSANTLIQCIATEASFNDDFLTIGGKFVEGTLLIVPKFDIVDTELDFINEWVELLLTRRFISVGQFRRFIMSSTIRVGDRFVYFTPSGVSQEIGLYVVENGQFKEVQ